jgi:CRP/FNR family transcriptional regulator, cyclic AMP receptor protein
MPTHNDGRAHLAPSLREVFDRVSVADPRLRFDAQAAIYANGDEDESMYLIDSGQVKLSMSSASGKDCLLAIYTNGEVFGESCFTSVKRSENATAMQPTVVRRVSKRDFLAAVEKTRTFESLLAHLTRRIAERQMAVFDLVTMSSERRLAKVLLEVAEKLGVAEGPYLKLDQKISHEELSQMVGTTRPRITAFIKGFRERGLVMTVGRAMNVHRQKVREFVDTDL